MKRLFITDGEVANVLEISPVTLTRIMSGFVRGGKLRKSHGIDVDLKAAEPIVVRGFRRWNVEKLAKVLDISKDELLAKIS